jgi:hypothetical protein
MDNDLYVDPFTQDRIIAEAVRRGRRRQRRWRLMGAGGALAVAAGAALIGLALVGGPPAQRVTTSNPAVVPTTARPAAGTAPSAPPAAAGTVPAFPSCRSAQLRVSVIPYGYGMGEGSAQISYVNTSPAGCTLEGYPGITISGRSGTASISATPTTPGRYLENQNLGSYPPSPMAIHLPKGGRAVSYIGWDGGASLPANRLSECPTGPWTVTITLPGGGGVVEVDGNLGMGVCSNLEAEPIQPVSYQPAP